MALIKWTPFLEPFEEMEKMMRHMAHGSGTFAPAINMYETKTDMVVETALAGIKPEDVDVSIEDNVLTIKGEAKHEREVDEKNYYRREVRSGSFYRSIPLPGHVLGEKASADYENGILKISIPKTEEEKPKSIKIDIGKK